MRSALKACTREHPRCDLPAANFENAATSAPPSRCNFRATEPSEQHIHFLAHQVVNHLASLILARAHLAQDCGRLRCLRHFATNLHHEFVCPAFRPSKPSALQATPSLLERQHFAQPLCVIANLRHSASENLTDTRSCTASPNTMAKPTLQT